MKLNSKVIFSNLGHKCLEKQVNYSYGKESERKPEKVFVAP